jgi:hypothetical protein
MSDDYISLVRKQHLKTQELREELQKQKELTQKLARDCSEKLVQIESLNRELLELKRAQDS